MLGYSDSMQIQDWNEFWRKWNVTSILLYKPGNPQQKAVRQPKAQTVQLDAGYSITNSMEQIPSWEAISTSASQEISHLLWDPKDQLTG
jgi:hypothetical protein